MLKAFTKADCVRIPYYTGGCRYEHHCNRCAIAERFRQSNREFTEIKGELFGYYDVLPKTPKGGGLEYVYKPLILKPEAMEAHGIKLELFNQIFVATDGAGMFSEFPGSQIDGYLLSDRRKIYTFGRQEFFGVPNERAVKRFEDLFLIDLNKYIERGRCL